jgi:hypothetical protein
MNIRPHLLEKIKDELDAIASRALIALIPTALIIDLYPISFGD